MSRVSRNSPNRVPEQKKMVFPSVLLCATLVVRSPLSDIVKSQKTTHSCCVLPFSSPPPPLTKHKTHPACLPACLPHYSTTPYPHTAAIYPLHVQNDDFKRRDYSCRDKSKLLCTEASRNSPHRLLPCWSERESTSRSARTLKPCASARARALVSVQRTHTHARARNEREADVMVCSAHSLAQRCIAMCVVGSSPSNKKERALGYCCAL